MKKIKKIAASLMALAVTTASMSSIPANAVSQSVYRTLWWNNYTQAESACFYDLGYSYLIRIRSDNQNIYSRNIQLWAKTYQGSELHWYDQFSAHGNPFITACPPDGQRIKTFYSYCTAWSRIGNVPQQRLGAYMI